MNVRAFVLLSLLPAWLVARAESSYFEIAVLDAETGRGIPLVELETVHRMKFVTDNAGLIAFHEPGVMGQTVFFSVKAQGYEVPKDGFGIAGARLKVEEGGRGEVRLKRVNAAERLHRLTGLGLYRDSVLLGKATPLREPLGAGLVAGQDSVSAVAYRDRLFWFWGDTGRLSYPLGLFRMAGATSALPGKAALPVAQGIDYEYFTGEDGFCRAMAEVANPEGVVWAFGFATVPDRDGRERLVAHFSRRKGLVGEFEQGMMLYNDERELLEVATTLPLEEKWRYLDGQPVRVRVDGVEYLQCGSPFPTVRVPATLEAVLDPAQYEAFTCLPPGADPDKAAFVADAEGAPRWGWRKDAPPATSKQEWRWLKDGSLKAEHARFLPEDAEQPGRRVQLHGGTARWNEHLKKWVMIAVEFAYHEGKDYPSALGEVWYAEAEAPEGPFVKATRVVTHEQQTFYNPVHHAHFDEEGGRVIYFEGTYSCMFTNSPPTPRYDYNQILYRLDLEHPKLRAAFPRQAP